MPLAVPTHGAAALLGAMRHVATTGGTAALSAANRRSMQSCARHFLSLPDPTPDDLPPATARDLAACLTDNRQREAGLRCLAVTALVDGSLDAAKVRLVLDYAATLEVRPRYLEQLEAAVSGRLAWALSDMTRQNIRSLWNRPWDETDDIMALLLPYRGAGADPALAARHEALGGLPEGTFGRAWWEIYKKNRYAFPGDPKGANAAFTRPHDSTHVLSGYDTTPPGEILVSTFTAGMHPVLPMEGHVLPVLFSWHLGIEINEFAGSAVGALDPAGFWEAWSRGMAMQRDLFAPDWDFWAVVEEPVESLRRRYRVPPLGAGPAG